MCRRNVLLGQLLVVVLLLLGGAVAHAGSDVFSVNFYYTPWPWPAEDTHNITLEDADQSAGFGDWLTDGWQDIEIPWAPPGPQDPVPITSKKGSTATFTLTAARNGGSYSWDQVRTTLLGDGNGDMMDGHANGTEDEDELIDMTVSDIPFKNYDVIIYMGSQSAQFGDGTGKIVFNGVERGFTLTSGAFDGTFAEIVDATTPGNYIVYEGLKDSSFTVQAWGNGFNHIGPCGFQIRAVQPELAADPSPAEESIDVSRDVVLGWSPGETAAAHDLYLGTDFNRVNDATTSSEVYLGRQDGTTLAPERLQFDTTYYWRVDEVNGAPDNTIFKGDVWSFTTELLAYPIGNVTASSNGIADVGSDPENTVNGSGLNADDQHSIEITDMWLASPAGDEPLTITFEFDRVHRMHEMVVWNYNVAFELLLGFGVKDATVEYSTDGAEWATLGDVALAQATAKSDYAAPTTVDLQGVPAQYVRLLVNSAHGTMGKFGLSEVRFLSIPVHPTEPEPAVGVADISVSTNLSWRAGREAVSHDVYLSTDPDALALIDSVADSSADPGALDLATTYYWRIDEVNETEAVTLWAGDVWSFVTETSVIVDDFESYDDEDSRIYQTWNDGYEIDENGSQVGHSQSPFAELTIVHGGGQSMPLAYDNTSAASSEATRTFGAAQNWTLNGIKVLSLWVHGDPANDAQQIYVKINNTKVPYSGQAPIMSEPRWRQWEIPLEEVANQGVNLQSVTQFGIGFDRIGAVGGQGIVFIDDIQLNRPVVSDVTSIAITVPNGDFEEIYKPGADTITADLGAGWTQGVGPDAPMDDGTALYSDGASGDAVDIPGWIGADAQGWLDNGGTYDRDTAFPNRQGAVAAQIFTPDGLYYYLSNGGAWGNPAGGLIVSDAPVAAIESGLTYTLSMVATGPDGPATPVVLELLADGVALTPSSSVDPALSGDWREFSRTYDAASLAGHVGESLTIRLGVDRGAGGGQTCFDAVSLSYVEPVVSLVENFDSLAVGANMHEVDGWEGWYGDAQWGARVTDVVAYSGTNCLEIVGTRDDLVPNWPQQTSGQWMLKVMQYCPSNVATAGKMYFGALSEYDGAAGTVAWVGSLIADFGTGKAYCEEDQAIQVDLVYDTWVELRVEIDLDSQMAHLYYNDVFLATRPASSIAGVDIWPTDEIETVYFDDFSFEQAL